MADTRICEIISRYLSQWSIVIVLGSVDISGCNSWIHRFSQNLCEGKVFCYSHDKGLMPSFEWWKVGGIQPWVLGDLKQGGNRKPDKQMYKAPGRKGHVACWSSVQEDVKRDVEENVLQQDVLYPTLRCFSETDNSGLNVQSFLLVNRLPECPSLWHCYDWFW